MIKQEGTLTSASLKAPRAGAIAGIVFSLLFIMSLVLTRISVPANPEDAGAWLSGGWTTVNLAFNLLPFAGIAFLWFIGVLRDRMGVREDRFFATVFFGSGLLFVAMLFVASAVASGMLMLYRTTPDKLIESGIYQFGRTLVYQITNVFTMKMAGVFMISTCTVSVRIRIFPQWMAFLGYALALLLILSSKSLYWTPLVFPLWVLLISIYILLANLKSKSDDAKETIFHKEI